MLLYIYGLNNPLVFVDPMGLFGWNPWTWGCAGKQWSQMMNRNAELAKRQLQEHVESGLIDEQQARNDAFDIDYNISMTELGVAGIEAGAKVKVLEAGVNAAVEVALVPVGGAVFSAGRKGLQALRAADKAADVARAADGLSDAGRRLRVNQANSARAEAATAKQFPGSQSQVVKQTTGGSRKIDTLTDARRAIETKVGRQSLTKNARRQIARDVKLRRHPFSGVKSLQWNFYRSPITGRIGPTGPLRSALQRHGFDIYHHPLPF